MTTAKGEQALMIDKSALESHLASTTSGEQAATFEIEISSYPGAAPAGVRMLPTASSSAESVDERSEKAEAILLAALETFTVQGYAAASMSQIAATAGVSKPALYSYFKDKEGLFTALIEQILARARHPLSSLTIGHDPHSSPEDVFRQIARIVVTEFNGTDLKGGKK